MERPEDRVALIEWLDHDGHVQRSVDVAAWPLSLGRALDNTVVLDDPHVAAHHLRLAPDEHGQLQLQALPSRNGLMFNGLKLNGAALAAAAPFTAVAAGSHVLQLGTTQLRLRVRGPGPAAGSAAADEHLAAEKPLPGTTRAKLRVPLLAAAGVLLLALAGHWVTLDPGADYTAWLPLLVGVPAALAAWCGLWALLSKLFQHRFDFSGHLRIALPWLLLMSLIDPLWPQLTAALALPGLWKLGNLLENGVLVLLLHAHLRHTLPQHGRAVTAAVATLAVVGVGLSTALTWRSHDSLVAAPYMSTLPMPALRWAGTVPSEVLVQDMAPLAAQLAARVAQARQDDEAGKGEGDDAD